MTQRGQAVPNSGIGGIPILTLLPVLPTVATPDITVNWLRINSVFTLSGTIETVAKSRPTGSNVIIDVLRSQDGGSSFTSIFTSGHVVFTVSGPPDSVNMIASLDVGDLLRVDLLQPDSNDAASGLSFAIVPA